MSDEPDTSDIPEGTEEDFAKAKLVEPELKPDYPPVNEYGEHPFRVRMGEHDWGVIYAESEAAAIQCVYGNLPEQLRHLELTAEPITSGH